MSLHPFEHARLERRTFWSPRVAPPALMSCSMRLNLVTTPLAPPSACSVNGFLNGRETVVKLLECCLCFFHGVLIWNLLDRLASERQQRIQCEDVDGVETTYFLSQTLQSKHESHTSQKRSCTTATDTACSDPATTCKASENHVPRNGAYNHFCPKPWKHALLGRPPLACHRLWDWAVPLRLDASSSEVKARRNVRQNQHPPPRRMLCRSRPSVKVSKIDQCLHSCSKHTSTPGHLPPMRTIPR